MRTLLPELKRVFKIAPLGIALVLILDVLEITLVSLKPVVIGSCIDTLFERKYFWLYILIALQLLLILARFVNKTADTRVYERIIKDESDTYYETAIQTIGNDSTISSRLNLVDEIPSFFDVELISIIDVVGQIVVSLIFIYFYSGLILFLSAVIVSALICFLTKGLHREIAESNVKLQNYDEVREEIISSRSKQRFRDFTAEILNLSVRRSDLDARAYLWTDVLQAGLLVFVIVFTINAGGYTTGQLFSVITYTLMLNECVSEINEIRVRMHDLTDTVARLKKGGSEL